VICIYHQIFFGCSKQEEGIGRVMTFLGRGDMNRRFLLGASKGKKLLGRYRFYERVILF